MKFGDSLRNLQKKDIHVTVLTNAIVDILAHVEDTFLETHGIQKGGYRIISKKEMESLYEKIPPAIEQSGGSLANTAATFSLMGGKACCLAKVTDDAFGRIFLHDMRAAGVNFPLLPAQSLDATGRSIILIDEQGDRSMNTNLGSSIDLYPHDLCLESIKNAHILCVEGYFWSHEGPKLSVYHAIETAKQAETLIAFGLSSVWCVEKFGEEFLSLMNGSIDILLGNEREYMALFKMPLEEIILQLSTMSILAVITRGNQGSIIVNRSEILYIPPTHPERCIDATGAGDAYASGFLYGLTHRLDLKESGTLGSLVASLTIAHVGARPERLAIKEMMRKAGLKSE